MDTSENLTIATLEAEFGKITTKAKIFIGDQCKDVTWQSSCLLDDIQYIRKLKRKLMVDDIIIKPLGNTVIHDKLFSMARQIGVSIKYTPRASRGGIALAEKKKNEHNAK